MPTRRHRSLLLVLFTVLLAAGCSSSPGMNVKNPFGGAEGMKTIRIEIVNLNWSDATIYAFRGGERHRLGIVTGKTDDTFTMDWVQQYDLRFEIDLLAAGRCMTESLNVAPGEIVELRIDPVLERMATCRRN